MNRGYALTAATVAVLGIGFIAGASSSPGRATAVDEKKPDAVKPPAVIGHKTAVFNMAAVMRDFHQAKYKVWLLNKQKEKMSKQLLDWRNEYIKLQQEVQSNPNHPQKEQLTKQMVILTRQIEDEDKKINKKLNDDASAIIVGLYDAIKSVVDRTAEANGFQLVLAYPDAVTPEEVNNPHIKELKLKPPAAQPFYVAPEIDITARVIKTLNEKHPPLDPETKEPVDLDKLMNPPVPATGIKPLPVPRPSVTLPMGLGGSRPGP